MNAVEVITKREFRWWESTPEKLSRLKWAYMIDCTDKEACAAAGISKGQLYYYQKQYPEFVTIKKDLKMLPVIKARQTIVNDLSNPKTAWKYLEKKCPQEFGRGNEIIPNIIPIDIRESGVI